MAKDELDLLINEIKKDIKKIALMEVTSKIKDIHQEVIEDVVYSAYEPTYYDRRYEEDGLIDKENMQMDYIEVGNELEIGLTNATRGNEDYVNSTGYENGYIADIIENGVGYGYGLDSTIGARPFQEKTQERIDIGSEIEEELEIGLRVLGYDFE